MNLMRRFETWARDNPALCDKRRQRSASVAIGSGVTCLVALVLAVQLWVDGMDADIVGFFVILVALVFVALAAVAGAIAVAATASWLIYYSVSTRV